MTYPTPDAAIRAALAPPSIGIDYAKVRGDRHEAEMSLVTRSHVLAVLAQLDAREWAVVVAYAHHLSYREIARRMRISDRTVRRVHRPAWERVRRRLVQMEVVEA